MAAGRRRHVCTSCGATYTRRHNLDRHMREQHATDTAGRHVCDQCGAVLPRRYRLQAHMASWHAAGTEHRFSCALCPATWATRAGLARHVRSHSMAAAASGGSDEGRREIACPDCGRVFSHYWRMRLHWQRHASARHTCHVCRQMFRQRSALVAHVGRQHGERQCALIPAEPPEPGTVGRSGSDGDSETPGVSRTELLDPAQQLISLQSVDSPHLVTVSSNAAMQLPTAVRLPSVEFDHLDAVQLSPSHSNSAQLDSQSDSVQLGSVQLDSVDLLEALPLDAGLLASGVRVKVQSRSGADETVMLITLVDEEGTQ